MKKSLLLLTLVATSLVFSSCASNSRVEKKINQEIKDVPVSETQALTQQIKDKIATSNMTAEQKKKLMELEERAHIEKTAITEEIEKTKVVFIQTILSPKMNQREYLVLKKKLTDLNAKRLNNGFKIAEEVRKVVNPSSKTTEEQEIYKAVIENRLRGF